MRYNRRDEKCAVCRYNLPHLTGERGATVLRSSFHSSYHIAYNVFSSGVNSAMATTIHHRTSLGLRKVLHVIRRCSQYSNHCHCHLQRVCCTKMDLIHSLFLSLPPKSTRCRTWCSMGSWLYPRRGPPDSHSSTQSQAINKVERTTNCVMTCHLTPPPAACKCDDCPITITQSSLQGPTQHYGVWFHI